VIGAPAGGAGEAPGQALGEVLLGRDQVQGAVEAAAELPHHAVQGLGLRDRAREAVEDEAVLGVGMREPVADQVDHQIVGDEPAGVVDRLHSVPDLGARRHGRPQHVPGGDVRDAVRRGDPLRLRSLSRALRAQEQDAHGYFKNPS
jgi:hypothetical protein